MKTLFVFTLLTVFISGCSSLSKDECLAADWHMIGTEDGSLGRPLTTLAKHRKACSKVHITPDQQAYEAGHQKGLMRYCIYDNGYKLGASGGMKKIVCPEAKAAEFDQGYIAGQKVYQAKRDLQQTQKDVDSLLATINALTAEKQQLEDSLVNGEGDADSRREALESIKALEQDIELNESDLAHLERTLQKKQRYYNHLIK